LFAQFSGSKPVEKAASSPGSASEAEEDDDEINPKLVKQIANSINSYSLEEASNNAGSPRKSKPAAEATVAHVDDEISSFSDTSV